MWEMSKYCFSAFVLYEIKMSRKLRLEDVQYSILKYTCDISLLLKFIIVEHSMYLFVYFNSKKGLNCYRFVDLNIIGAQRLVHSYLRIYRISFFLLDIVGNTEYQQ